MSRTLLFNCSPRRISDGAVVPVRLAYKARGAAAFFGVQYEPVVQSPPSFERAIGFDGRLFGEAPTPQVGELVAAMSLRLRAQGAAGLIWKDAAVTIMAADWPAGGGNPADGAFATVWQGRADDMTATGGLLRVTLVDAGQLLRVPVCAQKFGTSGVALLDSADAVKDRASTTVVPRAFGRVLSIPGLLVDRANNIWLFAASPASSVEGFYDGGAAFTLGTARTSLAALQANVPAAGRVDYVRDAGGLFLARPWDEPVYPFTADATFGSQSVGDIAAALVGSLASFRAGAVSAINAAVGAGAGLYINDDTEVATALDRLLAGLGIGWKLQQGGTIDMARLGWASASQTIPAHRRAAPERLRVLTPTARRAIGYARNNRVHSEGEIAQALLAGDITYADGTPVEALKPADPGATAGAPAGTPVGAYPDAAAVKPAVDSAATTANWSGIIDTGGKPADNATRNVDRGAWSAGVAFVVGDEVQDQSSTWGCIAPHTSAAGNRPPTLPSTANTWWRLRAKAGDAGPQGPTGISGPPPVSLATGGGQFAVVYLSTGQTVTVAARLKLNAGGSTGTCSLQLQVSEAAAGSWTAMTDGTVTDSSPTSEPIDLEITGATFTNTGTARYFDIRAVSVTRGRGVVAGESGMQVL